MRQDDLEEYVASRFMGSQRKKGQKSNYIWTNTEYPWAHGNIDRLVVGEKAGLECKTTSHWNLKRIKDGDYPAYYYVQCALPGCDRIAQMGTGSIGTQQGDSMWFEIERDEAEIQQLGL